MKKRRVKLKRRSSEKDAVVHCMIVFLSCGRAEVDAVDKKGGEKLVIPCTEMGGPAAAM